MKWKRWILALMLSTALVLNLSACGAQQTTGYQFTVPKEKRVRVIVHTDCKNEADDQYALAHILMTPQFDVEGIIAGHFYSKQKAGSDTTTVDMSYDEITKILNLMDLTSEYPVYRGSAEPLADETHAKDSEGAQFIIDEALRSSEEPLYIIVQGALTDLASAILEDPSITEYMTCIWIGGDAYPDGGEEFNLAQDVQAANVVFASDMPVWQIPADVYQDFAVSFSELQVRVQPYGDIGNYLFEETIELSDANARNQKWPQGESWILGDQAGIAALMASPDRADLYEEMEAPQFDPDTMQYITGTGSRDIRVYQELDVRETLEDFYCKLQINYAR